MKFFLENNFMCLVTLWKCYFPPPPPQYPPPHNRKTTKTPPPTPPQQQQQNQRSKRESKKSKSQTNFITKISNENENESVRVGSRCGASGFVRVCRREWVHRASSVRVGSQCNDLSTLFVSLFARGPEMARRSWWSVTRFDEGGFERSERCDRLTPTSAIFLLFFSLSFLFSKAGNHLKWKWKRKWFFVILALIFGQLEMLFSLTEFEVTTKHQIFQKIISGISLKSIQTRP